MVCFNKGVSKFAQYVEATVNGYRACLNDAPKVQPKVSPLVHPAELPLVPQVLILAPHPDDECLMAGMALRMKQEWNANVFVVPFSYGSKLERRKARAEELRQALLVLGFELCDPRQNDSLGQLTQVEFKRALKQIKPDIIFSPHAKDLHPIHVAAHELIKKLKPKAIWYQTEFWQTQSKPNLFVPLSAAHVIQIGEALMKHKGEIARNPYHLRLPAWYIDQARRAQEIISGLGSAAENSSGIIFGQLFGCVKMQNKAPKR